MSEAIDTIVLLGLGAFIGAMWMHNRMFDRTKHEVAFVSLVSSMITACADDAKFAPDCKITRALKFTRSGEPYRLVIERPAPAPIEDTRP